MAVTTITQWIDIMNLQESIRSDLDKINEELIPTEIVSEFNNAVMANGIGWRNIYASLITLAYDIKEIKKMDAAYIEKEFTPEEMKIIKKIIRYGEQSTKLAQELVAVSHGSK
jgi:hypothetical protein